MYLAHFTKYPGMLQTYQLHPLSFGWAHPRCSTSRQLASHSNTRVSSTSLPIPRVAPAAGGVRQAAVRGSAAPATADATAIPRAPAATTCRDIVGCNASERESGQWTSRSPRPGRSPARGTGRTFWSSTGTRARRRGSPRPSSTAERTCSIVCVLIPTMRSGPAMRRASRNGEIVLTEVYAIGVREAGDVGPVVHDEESTGRPRPPPHISCPREEFPVREALFSKLNDGSTPRDRSGNHILQRSRALRTGHDHIESGLPEPLPPALPADDGAFHRIRPITQRFELPPEVGVDQLPVFLQTSQGFLQPLEIDGRDLGGGAPIVLATRRQVGPHVRRRISRRQEP